MADRVRLVEFTDRRARPRTVSDLQDAVNTFFERGTWTVTPPSKAPVMSRDARRFGGETQRGESHGNGSVSFTGRVKDATSADAALARLETFLAALNDDGVVGRYVEWRPQGASRSVYFPIRATAGWQSNYQNRQFVGAQSVDTQVSIPVAPLAEWDHMDILDDFTRTAMGPLLATNLIPNPSFEVDTIGWGGGTSRSAGTGAQKGGYSFRLNVASGGGGFQSPKFPVTAGQSYVPSLYWDCATNSNGAGVAMVLRIEWQDAAGTSLATGTWNYFGTAGASGRLVGVADAAPTGATQAYLNIFGNGTLDMYIDGIMMVAGTTTPAYFDGDSDNAVWTGARGNSSSVLYGESKFADYTYDYGAAGTATSFTIAGGQLFGTPGTAGNSHRRIVHTGRGYQVADTQVTAKVVVGASATGIVALILKRVDSGNYIYVSFDSATMQIGVIESATYNSPSPFQNGTSAFTANNTFWVRARIEGNVIIGEFFTIDPALGGTPTQTTTLTLTGGAATRFGAGVKGYQGISWGRWQGDGGPGTDWRIDDFTVEPFTYAAKNLPAAMNLAGVPGSAPALCDVHLGTTAGQQPVFGLFGWAPTPGTPVSGAVAPLGVIGANTADGATLSNVTVSASGAARSGSIATGTVSGGYSEYLVDPSTMACDDFRGEVDVEIYARVLVSAINNNQRVVASLVPDEGTGYGAERYTNEWGAIGRPLPAPSSGTAWRLTRLGTLTMPVDSTNRRRQRIRITQTFGTGSTGSLSLDQLILVPARARMASPTGKPNDASYPRLAPSTAELRRVFRSDGRGMIGKPQGSLGPYAGLDGARMMPDPGAMTLVGLLSDRVPDDTTSDATADSLTLTAKSLHVGVIPRSYLTRGT